MKKKICYFFPAMLIIVALISGIWCVATGRVISDGTFGMFVLGCGLLMVVEFRKIRR